MTFSERLMAIRKQKGKTITEMAFLLGMSTPGYKRIEDGIIGKTFEKLPTIAKALGCRIDDLFPEMDDAAAATEDKTASEREADASATCGRGQRHDGFDSGPKEEEAEAPAQAQENWWPVIHIHEDESLEDLVI